jgi:exodeoxyribonuclease V alpha subunit
VDPTEAAEGGLERVEGTLERVTFHSEETGFTVARLVPDGSTAEVTIVGRLASPQCGLALKLEGHWTTSARYGRQFEVTSYSERLPATTEGIRRYLGSGLVPGIGRVMAERIVAAFGSETLEVIESSPGRLAEVPGIGPSRSAQIVAAWREQAHIRDLMVFLQSHGVSTGLAVRIYRRFGDDAAAVLREDPYRLAREVYGIGFTSADRIARRLGLPADSPRRAEAGILDTLLAFADDGHVFARRSTLAAETERRLAVASAPEGRVGPTAGSAGAGPTAEQIHQAMDRMAKDGDLVIDKLGAVSERLDPAIYLPAYYYAEVAVADRLRGLLDAPESRLGQFRAVRWDAAFDWLDRRLPHRLAACQRQAVQTSLSNKVTVLTGGPGTGKTTTVRAVLLALQARGGSVQLGAPTGRAAKRLSEATGMEARTLHRLLEFKPSEGWRFMRDETRPLDADLIVVDEMSMVDLPLMNALTRAITPGTHLLLVGDADQLPSVGPGSVLHDLIASGAVPTVALDQIFRQDAHSFIVVNAHRINRGEMPLVERDSKDFFLFKAADAASAADWIVDIVTRRIPARFGLDAVDDVQVLSPMYRGQAGVAALNSRLQAALNPPAPGKAELVQRERVFRVGDKVMQLRNDYQKGVFNGDLGRLLAIDPDTGRFDVCFDGETVVYDAHEADELVHAFACSTHKSQGAEYPAVVMAILPQHYLLLQRNLLYTGVTRARKLCVLVGAERAIAQAVRNDKVASRNTGLAQRLRLARGGGHDEESGQA